MDLTAVRGCVGALVGRWGSAFSAVIADSETTACCAGGILARNRSSLRGYSSPYSSWRDTSVSVFPKAPK